MESMMSSKFNSNNTFIAVFVVAV